MEESRQLSIAQSDPGRASAERPKPPHRKHFLQNPKNETRKREAKKQNLKPTRIKSFSECRLTTKSIRRPHGPAKKAARHTVNGQRPSSGGEQTEAANNKAATDMDRKNPARAQRFNASHVVEAELEHLDWATRQPALRMLDAVYWRRRVLAVKCGFELTDLQVMRLEKILQRLGHPSE